MLICFDLSDLLGQLKHCGGFVAFLFFIFQVETAQMATVQFLLACSY